MIKSYEVTEQERESIERALFEVAAEMLRPTAPARLEEYALSDFQDCVIAVLRATDAVKKRHLQECRRIAKENGADYADLHVDANHIVASALLASTDKHSRMRDWSPYCAGAVPMLVFARAFALGHIANQFDNLAGDYDTFLEPGVALRALGEQGDDARDPREST